MSSWYAGISLGGILFMVAMAHEYNSDGMLTTVVTSSGRQRQYDYAGALMTQITDERGHVLVHNWYESGLLRRQEFGNGAVYSYNYDWSPGSYYPEKVVVTLPDQTRQELSVSDSVPEFVRNYRR